MGGCFRAAMKIFAKIYTAARSSGGLEQLQGCSIDPNGALINVAHINISAPRGCGIVELDPDKVIVIEAREATKAELALVFPDKSETVGPS